MVEARSRGPRQRPPGKWGGLIPRGRDVVYQGAIWKVVGASPVDVSEIASPWYLLGQGSIRALAKRDEIEFLLD
jgi:hypothetical protein